MKSFQVRVIMLNGQWLDMTISHSDESADKAFISWCKVIKADGAIYNEGACLPWHAVFQIVRVDQVAQQIALAQVGAEPGTKVN